MRTTSTVQIEVVNSIEVNTGNLEYDSSSSENLNVSVEEHVLGGSLVTGSAGDEMEESMQANTVPQYTSTPLRMPGLSNNTPPSSNVNSDLESIGYSETENYVSTLHGSTSKCNTHSSICRKWTKGNLHQY